VGSGAWAGFNYLVDFDILIDVLIGWISQLAKLCPNTILTNLI